MRVEGRSERAAAHARAKEPEPEQGRHDRTGETGRRKTKEKTLEHRALGLDTPRGRRSARGRYGRSRDRNEEDEAAEKQQSTPIVARPYGSAQNGEQIHSVVPRLSPLFT